ncbi:hypothetical protein D623_10026311 [Myotis brandtii]|uniref:Uncharacterized protein n=1 Tax=Myotis brandtii TaxID=109478 RepID=S7ME81_MYOBR|nr:hypothetical protein D623_10026311 [Myotis brandtii]
MFKACLHHYTHSASKMLPDANAVKSQGSGDKRYIVIATRGPPSERVHSNLEVALRALSGSSNQHPPTASGKWSDLQKCKNEWKTSNSRNLKVRQLLRHQRTLPSRVDISDSLKEILFFSNENIRSNSGPQLIKKPLKT